MVSEQTKCLDHGGEDSTLIILWKDWKKKKKPSLCVRRSVGSPTSAKHGPIEVNIYGGTFLPLQGLLVGDKRGSEILTKEEWDDSALKISNSYLHLLIPVGFYPVSNEIKCSETFGLNFETLN